MKRQPQGIPTGGQFAEDRKAEPSTSLPSRASSLLGASGAKEPAAIAKELGTQYRSSDGQIRDLRQIIVDGGETKVSLIQTMGSDEVQWCAHRGDNGVIKISEKLSGFLRQSHGFTDESDERTITKFYALKIRSAQAQLKDARDADRRHMIFSEENERRINSASTKLARTLKAGSEETGLSEEELTHAAIRVDSLIENDRRQSEGLSRFSGRNP